jgi:hypothetical protein
VKEGLAMSKDRDVRTLTDDDILGGPLGAAKPGKAPSDAGADQRDEEEADSDTADAGDSDTADQPEPEEDTTDTADRTGGGGGRRS